MIRTCLLGSAMALLCVPAHGAASLTTDLHGKACKTVALDRGSGASTRQWAGVRKPKQP